MTSYCNCATCQRINKQILERKPPVQMESCRACGKVHPDYRSKDGVLFCPFAIDPTFKEEVKSFLPNTTYPWATSKDFKDEKK